MTNEPNRPVITIENLADRLSVQSNFDQSIIAITEDKLDILLRDYEYSLAQKNQILPSVAALVAGVITFISTDFKPIYGISASAYQMLFVAALIYLLGIVISSLYKFSRGLPIRDRQHFKKLAQALEE